MGAKPQAAATTSAVWAARFRSELITAATLGRRRAIRSARRLACSRPSALSGTGCGYTEADAALNLIAGAYANCLFGGHAKVDGDVVRGRAVMAYSADPDEKRGQPFSFEANLSTGFCRFTDMNYGMGTEVIVEGTGTVTRI